MKLVSFIGLMVCLSILVMLPVSAYVYADLTVVNVTLDPEPLGDYATGGDGATGHYYAGYVSALYKDCTDSASGDYISYTYDGTGSSGGLDPAGDFALTYSVPVCTTDFFSIVMQLGPHSFRKVLSWEYGTAPSFSACGFTSTPNAGAPPLAVHFNDTSTNDYTSWQWLVVENTTATTVANSVLPDWVATLNGVNMNYDVYYNAANATGNCLIFKPNLIHTELIVSQNATQRLVIEPTDAISNALVTGTALSVLDRDSLMWTNLTAVWGTQEFYVPYGSNLYIEGVVSGYQKSTKNWTVVPYPAYILKLPMYPTGSIAAANVSLNVVVLDGGTSGVMQNVQVRLSDGQVKYTTGAGVASFNVSAAKSYQIIASYTGYNSATRTLTTGAGGTSQDTYLTLNRIVVTTAPTLPPGVTAVVTLDTRTNAQKDQAMMDLVREWGNLLIPVACLMTLLYMFGYKP